MYNTVLQSQELIYSNTVTVNIHVYACNSIDIICKVNVNLWQHYILSLFSISGCQKRQNVVDRQHIQQVIKNTWCGQTYSNYGDS